MEGSKKYYVVSCSGASNTGKFADAVARQLSSKEKASMVCLPKIALGDQDLIQKVKSQSKKIIVLDGCPVNCAKKILQKEGITENIIHINTTDFDIIKGKTPYSKEKANEIINHIEKILDETNNEHNSTKIGSEVNSENIQNESGCSCGGNC